MILFDMVNIKKFLLLVFFLAMVSSKSPLENVILMEKYISNDNFRQIQRSDPNKEHVVVFWIHQKNMDELHNKLMERSTPGNHLYRKWLTQQEVADMIVDKEAIERALEWIENLSAKHSLQITRKTKNVDYISVKASIKVW